MNHGAEIFDRMQALFAETGWNDHQLHCAIRLDSRLDEAALRRAVELSLKAVPILATRYVEKGGRAVWESLPEADLDRAFVAVDDEAGFEPEATGAIREEVGPQLRLCLLRGDKSALAIIMNHMIADAGGFKDFLYLFCGIYSGLVQDHSYLPAVTIDGDRSLRVVTRTLGPWAKVGAWFSQREDSNRHGELAFPLGPDEDGGGEIRPFIATRIIDREKVARLRAYCKPRGATLNDAFLAAYYRALARRIGSAAYGALEIPIMIDMRRYLEDKSFRSLCNLASTAVTRIRQREGESFEETLLKTKACMDRLKGDRIGLGGFLKLELLFSLGDRRAMGLLRLGLRNPLICMTNIGDLDAGRLAFEGARVVSAYMCGSIKYKPYFQAALSGFDGSITLSSNLHGTAADRASIEAFLAELEEELSRN